MVSQQRTGDEESTHIKTPTDKSTCFRKIIVIPYSFGKM